MNLFTMSIFLFSVSTCGAFGSILGVMFLGRSHSPAAMLVGVICGIFLVKPILRCCAQMPFSYDITLWILIVSIVIASAIDGVCLSYS